MTGLQALSRDVADLVARAAPAVVGVEQGGGQGSGVVIAPDGWVLTNAHVARGRGPVRVRLSGARVVAAERAGADDRTDVAVLRVDARDLPALALSERRLSVGELVVAIGNPLGFERSVTVGVVSALHRNLAAPRGAVLEGLVQTDASINPGNSGGPLLDAGGAVVGLSTAMLPWAHGIGFAVPAHTAAWVASVLMREGEVRRPFLGIAARGEDLEARDATLAGHGRGVRVLEVVEGAPAGRAALRPGDLLVAASGSPVQTLDDLQRVLVLARAGEIDLQVLRAGRPLRLAIRPDPPRAAAA
ncbi:S1C family serine protease [Anaeromyxobacter dehalogenans]|uniref:Peptidase S1 and S6, chymotrypsin/Hap n=1 Tax=Anaeromyxobacter dehalogenans (strain 2CP-C) TaxID=290397 RepID=Q2IPA2_ANADE|nr:trypsin-like peptidase domain-containing protein [Anaeromyxobacter dehalogenans]ABC80630.1 peptidase S1 and S6, chymotrypsin/Hap [Anaeromyxobacter dehalogenans 2CP-C]